METFKKILLLRLEDGDILQIYIFIDQKKGCSEQIAQKQV